MAKSELTTMESNPWDRLYDSPRHHLRYPSEHVVRFIASHPNLIGAFALDIGCGAGRHTRLLKDWGYHVTAIDTSEQAVTLTKHAVPDATVTRMDMTDLRFDRNTFDLVIAANSLYYGTLEETRRAVRELHRVLKPDGHAFVVLRTTVDSRYCTVRMPSASRTLTLTQPETEVGLICNFENEDDLETTFQDFAELQIELTETTRRNQTRTDSDWLITVRK